jgi:hypothetical protein
VQSVFSGINTAGINLYQGYWANGKT